jgi:uncharacterized membrane protein
MRLWLSALSERMRSSLFVVPLAYVVFGIALAEGALLLDQQIARPASDLPLGLGSTVQSARAVLSTTAGATITVAGIAFSVSLLVLQQAASEYSPRVLSGLFRDPFNKRVIGITIGTFAYCLMVLRSVHTELGGGEPAIPNVAVALGVALGIVSILSVIAFISHNAHSMEIGEILGVVTRNARESMDANRSDAPLEPSARQDPTSVPATAPHVTRLDVSGWVQLIDHAALLRACPEAATVRMEVEPGDYVLPGTALCSVWPTPEGYADTDALDRSLRASVRVGNARTLRQDPMYGMRQITDVALRALSPGINDPTTAHEAIMHLATLLQQWLAEPARPADLALDGRRLVRPRDEDTDTLLTTVFGELRRAAAAQPRVCEYLVEALGAIDATLPSDRELLVGPALRRQALAVVAACAAEEPAPSDQARVRASAHWASGEGVAQR